MDFINSVGEESDYYQLPANIILYEFIITLFYVLLVRICVLVCVKMLLYALFPFSQSRFWCILQRIYN